ncbi:Uncharacterised protein [Serratia rubidaea]|uniref:Uncharacterized protein n=1 Tax=Serratia rubidaea TaxID=61652 RepID=A0A3S4GFM4_SERRU|nr:Uncharacterised protein [Serratia rubidaea]
MRCCRSILTNFECEPGSTITAGPGTACNASRPKVSTSSPRITSIISRLVRFTVGRAFLTPGINQIGCGAMAGIWRATAPFASCSTLTGALRWGSGQSPTSAVIMPDATIAQRSSVQPSACASARSRASLIPAVSVAWLPVLALSRTPTAAQASAMILLSCQIRTRVLVVPESMVTMNISFP